MQPFNQKNVGQDQQDLFPAPRPKTHMAVEQTSQLFSFSKNNKTEQQRAKANSCTDTFLEDKAYNSADTRQKRNSDPSQQIIFFGSSNNLFNQENKEKFKGQQIFINKSSEADQMQADGQQSPISLKGDGLFTNGTNSFYPQSKISTNQEFSDSEMSTSTIKDFEFNRCSLLDQVSHTSLDSNPINDSQYRFQNFPRERNSHKTFQAQSPPTVAKQIGKRRLSNDQFTIKMNKCDYQSQGDFAKFVEDHLAKQKREQSDDHIAQWLMKSLEPYMQNNNNNQVCNNKIVSNGNCQPFQLVKKYSSDKGSGYFGSQDSLNASNIMSNSNSTRNSSYISNCSGSGEQNMKQQMGMFPIREINSDREIPEGEEQDKVLDNLYIGYEQQQKMTNQNSRISLSSIEQESDF